MRFMHKTECIHRKIEEEKRIDETIKSYSSF